MHKFFAAAFAASGLCVSLATPGFALPPVGFNVAPQESAETSVDQTRLYCVNRWSGRFLHWGPCGGYYRPVYYRRVYCRNRYTGAFLHWGYC